MMNIKLLDFLFLNQQKGITMIDNFPQFRDALKANFDHLVATNPPIFQVNIDKNAFYQLYQNSFPDSTNPMYRVRREYDCSCCHHFINQVGSIII